MSDNAFFDSVEFLRAPRLDVPTAVALGVALASAVQEGAPASVGKAAKQLSLAVARLQQAWSERDRSVAAVDRPDPRAADQRLDRAWAAISKIPSTSTRCIRTPAAMCAVCIRPPPWTSRIA